MASQTTSTMEPFEHAAIVEFDIPWPGAQEQP